MTDWVGNHNSTSNDADLLEYHGRDLGKSAGNFAAIGVDSYYSCNDARAEVEFTLATIEENIIPVEVKSGNRSRAKLLAS